MARESESRSAFQSIIVVTADEESRYNVGLISSYNIPKHSIHTNTLIRTYTVNVGAHKSTPLRRLPKSQSLSIYFGNNNV